MSSLRVTGTAILIVGLGAAVACAFLAADSLSSLSFVPDPKLASPSQEAFFAHHKYRAGFFGLLALTACSLMALTGALLFWLKVLRPRRTLDRQMKGFLNQNYTYGFATPAPNEIGRLHSTFNDLAHKVLQQMEELKSLDRAKTEFIGITSHELRTPLTSIKGSLRLLVEGVGGRLPAEAKNLVEIADVEAGRLIRLINDLLDLSKLEAGRFVLKPSWFSLPDLIQETNRSLSGLALSRGLKLSSAELPKIDVYADRDRVQQILTNLISNALHHSPPQGVVRVAAEASVGEPVWIEVTDEGPGVAPEDQERIFDKFTQGERKSNHPSSPPQGTGLGLAIARALTEEHGGAIGLRSLVDRGTTFYFTLPQWRWSTTFTAAPDEHGATQGETTYRREKRA